MPSERLEFHAQALQRLLADVLAEDPLLKFDVWALESGRHVEELRSLFDKCNLCGKYHLVVELYQIPDEGELCLACRQEVEDRRYCEVIEAMAGYQRTRFEDAG
jgi:hypothetical protein